MILYYSLHINRVFSRYTLTEIQIMTSSNVSLLHFFVCHDFVCLIPIIVQIVFYYRVAVLLWVLQSSWIRHASEIATKENIKYFLLLSLLRIKSNQSIIYLIEQVIWVYIYIIYMKTKAFKWIQMFFWSSIAQYVVQSLCMNGSMKLFQP